MHTDQAKGTQTSALHLYLSPGGSNDLVVGLMVFLRPKRSNRGRPAVYKQALFTNTCLFVCWRHAWLWGLFMNTLFVNTFMFTFVYLSHLVNTSLWLCLTRNSYNAK